MDEKIMRKLYKEKVEKGEIEDTPSARAFLDACIKIDDELIESIIKLLTLTCDE